MKKFLLFCCMAILFGCGGGGGGSPVPVAPVGSTSFWAYDLTTDSSYSVNASQVAEGLHCYVYLEQGASVSPAAAAAIANQFDIVIYPADTAAFGSEPNPGIDGDPKIYLLLLKVKDGFNPQTSQSFVAGYYDSLSEYALSAQNPHSNQKEIIFMNINPAISIDPAGVDFFATIAHEFQHMIHWEQKTHQRGMHDDTWLDEAMAQVARTYCGYGPDYLSLYAYERDPGHSLTSFDETVGNYGLVYLWAQYIKDQFGTHDIFRQILGAGTTGIASVNTALSAIPGNTRDFAATFRDWAVANYFGNGSTVATPAHHPEWSYTALNTWPGSYPTNSSGQRRVTLPGLFPLSRQNLATLQPLDQWSLGYYSYIPATPPAGTVTWTRSAATTTASFIDGTTAPVTYDMPSGTATPFTGTGYLIYENPSLVSYASGQPADTVAHTAVAPLAAAVSAAPAVPRTASEALAATNASPLVRRLVQETGRPHPVHVDSYFREREKALRATGARPPF